MSIDNQADQAREKSSRIEKLYATIPGWQSILAAVKAGESEFTDVLGKMGLLQDFGLYTSAVHDYDEIELHAFILGIVSDNRWEEIQTKSFLTYASHWLDDFFDSPDRVINPSQLLADRCDIRRALANLGRIGEIGFAMADRVRHPEAVYKALQRMLYGGLVQRAGHCADRRALVEEYQSIAGEFVDPRLFKEIQQLQPEAYWTTNKTVLELLGAAEKTLDFSVVELWNLVYAPAIYYQDVEEERARGELAFEEEEEPRLSEMLRMIRLGAKHLIGICERNSLSMRQMEFVAISIPNLPADVVSEYRSLWEGNTVTDGLTRVRGTCPELVTR